MIMTNLRSCMLQDHYENLYAVVSGAKFFCLMPPSDAYRMSMKRYPLAQYKYTANRRLELQLKEPREVTAIRSPLVIASAASSPVKTLKTYKDTMQQLHTPDWPYTGGALESSQPASLQAANACR